jgi:hypothetical protein
MSDGDNGDPVTPNDNLYLFCLNLVGDANNTTEIFKCFSDHLSNDVGAREFSRSIMLVYAAGLVFFMQAGFASKSKSNATIQYLLCSVELSTFHVPYVDSTNVFFPL